MGPPRWNLPSTSDNRNDFALFIHHGGRFVTIENTKEYFGGDDSFRYGLDDREEGCCSENEDEHENSGKNAVCSQSENEDANDKSDEHPRNNVSGSEEDINDCIDNFIIGVQDELEQPEREEPTRRVVSASEDEVEDDDYTPEEESSSSDRLSADELGIDDKEYLNARSERSALRTNVPPENDQHELTTG
ncbi:flavin-monooxygenase glucosinolate S-oxygenase 4 [Striga asiatica]|uniref:Flavin-monooxygenase glucosinolate S-oxygenase 4 n=1 Tax=Striga asiatica TaxID=4170 RepID=A0A5A7P0T6_STRAF|nr:flavin-monooxygenase glucosinolate S-oxygenase 4 [Striga asiatica]